ncbi:MAG: HAMP domain-containing histidine kinase [Prevotella sp.]|nr:HAMP domain-containing histidine kinase [Prevotella sp.]
MNHFRLYLMLLTLMLIAVSVCIGITLSNGANYTYTILLTSAAILIIAKMMHIIRQLIHLMSYFVKALNNRDFMMRFPASNDDELQEMFSTMNRIAVMYQDNLKEIETKHFYYDRILKIMSHELRNSITPIVSLSSDMLKRPSQYQGPQLKEGLEVINNQCTGIKRFLDSYYEMTHLPQPQRQQTDIEQLFTRTRQLFKQELSKPCYNNVKLTFSYGNGMTVDADGQMLSQVLINLIKNALQATVDTQHPLIKVTASTPNGKPCITVSDNGTGIPDNIIKDIFHPFYTTRPEGTGIGLCISRQIMKLHGGDLTVTSKQGKGSIFTVTFQ